MLFRNLEAVANYVNSYEFTEINGKKGIKPFNAEFDTAANGENYIADIIKGEKGGYGSQALVEVWEKKSGGYVACIHHTIYDAVGIDIISELFSGRKNPDGTAQLIPCALKYADKKLVVGSDRKKSERLTLGQVTELWLTLSRLYKRAVITASNVEEVTAA